MKKLPALITAFFISVSAVSALEIPLVFGIGTLGDFNITSVKGHRKYETGLEGEFVYSIFSGGFFAFWDFFYGEAAFGFAGLLNSAKGNPTLAAVTGTDNHEDTILLSGSYLTLSLIGKYPFEFSGYNIYPVLGIEGRLFLGMNYTEDADWDGSYKGSSYNHEDASNWNSFFFRIGAGADFFITDTFFIRTTLTFGIKLNNPREREISNRIINADDYGDSTIFGAGGKLTVAVGYNFGSTSIGRGGGGGGGRGGRGGGRSSSRTPNDIYRPR